ncbi:MULTISPECIES: hypothetical protein, partial [Spiribacter]|uniref:hypothetical protein n=1 Tax=Spiribacter TaxID=1335745 RepID=UPI001C929DA1
LLADAVVGSFMALDIIRRTVVTGSRYFGCPLKPQASGRVAGCSGSTTYDLSAIWGSLRITGEVPTFNLSILPKRLRFA